MSENTKEKDFFTSIGRKHPDEEDKYYEVNPDVLEKALNILRIFTMKSKLDFYGFSLVPHKSDAILNLRVSHFDVDDLAENFYKTFQCASSITFIPGEEFMQVKIRISDFYTILTDEDMGLTF